MKQLNLSAKKREQIGKQVNDLRQQGLVPAVIYGNQAKNQNLVINYLELEKIYQQAGESSLIDLSIEGSTQPIKVLVQDIQTDPVTGRYLHIDFLQIKMDEAIKTRIPLKFIGESLAVKALGGILETSLDEIEVECLPGDLISEITVDLSPLKTFDDIIHIKDLQIPAGIKVLHDEGNAVAVINQPRIEKEEEKPVEGEEGEPELVGKEGEADKAEAGAEDNTEDKTKGKEKDRGEKKG